MALFGNKKKTTSITRRRPRKIIKIKNKPVRYRQNLSFAQTKRHQIKRIKKKRFKGNLHITRKILFKKIFLTSATILSIAGIIYLLFFSSVFALQKWEILENNLTFYNHQLDQYVKPFAGKNILFINTSEIKDQIAEKNPNLSKIEVKKSLPHTIIIKIEKFPVAANIINLIGDENIEQKLIINSIGLAIEKDNFDSNLPTIKVKSKQAFNILDQVIPPEKLDYITKSIKEFEETFGLRITQTEYLSVERELHLTTEKNFVIWLDIQQPSTRQLLKLKRALPKIDIYNTPLAYIDLRISGIENEKVIFKRK